MMDKAMHALRAMGFSTFTRIEEEIGWRGHGASSNDHFRCEFCGAEHLDATEIDHSTECPITLCRSAVSDPEAS